jgi:hypothetical protein
MVQKFKSIDLNFPPQKFSLALQYAPRLPEISKHFERFKVNRGIKNFFSYKHLRCPCSTYTRLLNFQYLVSNWQAHVATI